MEKMVVAQLAAWACPAIAGGPAKLASDEAMGKPKRLSSILHIPLPEIRKAIYLAVTLSWTTDESGLPSIWPATRLPTTMLFRPPAIRKAIGFAGGDLQRAAKTL